MVSPAAASSLSAVWANSGEDKVTRDELRATQGHNVKNSIWDGSRISLFGARNEVVAFNLILEASTQSVRDISVSFDSLRGDQGNLLSKKTSGNGVFDWIQRPIELFYVKYLPIKGLSKVSYEVYDERHVPERLRRPSKLDGRGYGSWAHRPGHDKFFPDIAIPLELEPLFGIPAGSNQSIWVDIYIPKSTAPGVYRGVVTISERGQQAWQIPVELKVYSFILPDFPAAKTMLYYSTPNINRRYLGDTDLKPGTDAAKRAALIRDRHYLLAHRHGLSLIGDSPEDGSGQDQGQPPAESIPRITGQLFTSNFGYAGPGAGVGNNVYSIGTYGSWRRKIHSREELQSYTDAWARWFSQQAPKTDYFLYLIDESSDTAQVEQWAQWIQKNPGPGKAVRSLATLPLPKAAKEAPSLDIPTSTLGVGDSKQWQTAADTYTRDARKRLYLYNGSRPATGSTAIEDDGIALRQRAWAQYKKNVDRWFFWETTYYNNYQARGGETNVYKTAHTFGGKAKTDRSLGETGWNYSNGDGVLFYPGTDRVYPEESYGIEGPFASLRLKYWRRGIQDVAYLKLAAGSNPDAVRAIVNQLIPKVLWEYGVDNSSDPTYVRCDVSWSDKPDVWEAARARLARIISEGAAR